VNLRETAEVLTAVAEWGREGRGMALATIVAVTGSTYRGPGARLLVPDEGAAVGNLSGGCLEGDVEQVARSVMGEGAPRLEFYDLTADDEAVWGWGLGCNGAIEVFVEPAARAAEIADALRAAIESERVVGVATILESSIPGVERGARVMLSAENGVSGKVADRAAQEWLVSSLKEAVTRGGAEAHDAALARGRVRAFIEVFEPPLRVVVCGAGHDAISLVKAAAAMGWTTVVVDDRAAFLNEERFPEARELLNCEPFEAAAKAHVDDRSYAVVMSHNYLRDRDYLRGLLDSDVSYIGMLGPRARTQRLLDDLAHEGLNETGADLSRIHGPAGLDLGAEGPEEIAAAIVAEILAVSRGRPAGHLRDKPGSIHGGAAVPGR
jgi:xanthine dehydrogenase accessory factor